MYLLYAGRLSTLDVSAIIRIDRWAYQSSVPASMISLAETIRYNRYDLAKR
jgi:hypothetical protein